MPRQKIELKVGGKGGAKRRVKTANSNTTKAYKLADIKQSLEKSLQRNKKSTNPTFGKLEQIAKELVQAAEANPDVAMSFLMSKPVNVLEECLKVCPSTNDVTKRVAMLTIILFREEVQPLADMLDEATACKEDLENAVSCPYQIPG